MKKVFLILAFGLCMFSSITATTEAPTEVCEVPTEEVMFTPECIAAAIRTEIAFCGEVLCNDNIFWTAYFECLELGGGDPGDGEVGDGLE